MDPDPVRAPRAPRTKKPADAANTQSNNVQPQKKNIVESVSENVKSDRFRYGLGITFFIIAVTMTLMMISFLKAGALDQSLVASGSLSEVADAPEGVANAGGAFGAILCHILFVDGLGIGSFILAFYFGALALALFNVVKINFWPFSFKCIFTALALSIIIGLFGYHSESFFHWGGNHGRYVNQWLFHVSGYVGAYAVAIFLIAMLVVIYLNYIRSAFGKAKEAYENAQTGNKEDTKIELDELPEEPKSEDVAEDEPTFAPQPAFAGFAIDDVDDDQYETIGSKTIAIDDINDDRTDTDPSANVANRQPIALQLDEDFGDEEEPATQTAQGVSDPSASTGNDPEFNIISHPGDNDSQDSSNDFGELTSNDFEPYDIRDDLSRYQFPTPDLLIDRPINSSIDQDEQEENKRRIVDTLKTYNIPIARIDATIGPTVTRYEILPEEGVRIAQIKRLEDDLARSLAALGIRIIAPIPGTSNIGIEVPNRDPQTVSMRSVITSKKFRECNMALPMALGTTIKNEIFIADLAKMPHLLVAGGTGQGKSVGLNCIIASLLYKKHPGELKFVLIDPKQLEFALYDKLDKHFLAKMPDEEEAIITDPMKALETLSSICVEMENRYSLLKKAGVRNIIEYNQKFTERRLNPEKGHRFMPYLVVIVDEFADLITTAGKDILIHISRIVAKARAAGIHMIIATQRPSTDVINGVIKSNFLGRIAFRVMQRVDSQTILDQPGANRLIGRGDMLFSHNSTMERVQCAFIDTPEVETLVDFIDNQIGYPTAYILPEPERENSASQPGAVDLSKLDDMFADCARFAVQNNNCSTSLLQRRFGIGYAKAGRIMDQLVAAGIVSQADGQKPRTILVDSIQLEDTLRSLGL